MVPSKKVLGAAALAVMSAGILTSIPSKASAASSAFAVTGVNMRAGPNTRYPVVVTLPAGAGLTLYGCTANTSWCDVSWGRERGWVASSYVQVSYQGARTVVTPAIAPVIGLSVVVFNQTYWNAHYVGRPWHNHWHDYDGPRGKAVAGCNDNGCGAAAVRPGRVAAGGCSDGTCRGISATRGPLGNVHVRRGSISRD